MTLLLKKWNLCDFFFPVYVSVKCQISCCLLHIGCLRLENLLLYKLSVPMYTNIITSMCLSDTTSCFFLTDHSSSSLLFCILFVKTNPHPLHFSTLTAAVTFYDQYI